MKEVKFEFGNVEQPKENVQPEETLRYVGKIGEDFAQYAIEIRAMLEEAKERGISVDAFSSGVMKKFESLGDYELVLIKLLSELISIQSNLLEQGVKMTREDIDARLKKMYLEG